MTTKIHDISTPKTAPPLFNRSSIRSKVNNEVVEEERMEKRLDDIYKEIREPLAQKYVRNDNDDDNNDKKHEGRITIRDMFLDPTPIKEIVQYSIEEYSPDKRVKK